MFLCNYLHFRHYAQSMQNNLKTDYAIYICPQLMGIFSENMRLRRTDCAASCKTRLSNCKTPCLRLGCLSLGEDHFENAVLIFGGDMVSIHVRDVKGTAE